MKANIRVERNNMLFRYGCYFCGGTIEKEDVRVKVYLSEDGSAHKCPPDKNPLVNILNPDKHSFHVCWDCAKGGPSRMKKALAEQARQFRKQAKECDYTSANLKIECPSWSQIQAEVKKTERKIEEEFEMGYWGVCPKCGKTDGYVNIERQHWFFCINHKIKWCVGDNLFSSWKDETEVDWQKNLEKIADFTEIKANDAETEDMKIGRLKRLEEPTISEEELPF